MSATAIELVGVGRTFDTSPPVRALDGITLHVDVGSIVALVGPSGSGKTTLLNIISGLDTATSGTVDVLGMPLHRTTDDVVTRWRRRDVAFIFQAKGLVSHLTAFENVDLALRLVGRPRADRHDAAHEMLDRVGLGELGDHRPAELSGGQQQRVAIARALVVQPSLLIADEPTGELDSETGAEMIELIATMAAAANTTALVATHDETFAAAADRVVRLVDGALHSEALS